MSVTEVLKAVRKMPVSHRVRLMERIWDTIDDEAISYELTPVQRREVERRLRAIEAHPEKGFTWEEVEAELTEAQQKELDRRIKAYREGTAKLLPWNEVKARLAAKLRSYRSPSRTRRRKG